MDWVIMCVRVLYRSRHDDPSRSRWSHRENIHFDWVSINRKVRGLRTLGWEGLKGPSWYDNGDSEKGWGKRPARAHPIMHLMIPIGLHTCITNRLPLSNYTGWTDKTGYYTAPKIFDKLCEIGLSIRPFIPNIHMYIFVKKKKQQQKNREHTLCSCIYIWYFKNKKKKNNIRVGYY